MIPNPESRLCDDILDNYIGVGQVIKEDNDYNFSWSCLISKEAHRRFLEKGDAKDRQYEFRERESNSMWNYSKERKDGYWMEVAFGEFFNETGFGKEKVFVEFNWWVIEHYDMFIIEGIEFRPKK
ncbi:hypothetical protein ZOSMA_178G00380 [Zostera marina]|uniref:Uncharacterized protein n=1 Tax=Zostera marina TaxID=29655 RepID=A0A0K9PTV2_ZOSMR|nr:hypothetical protein ZOSMA_178G00380 [Zostera marina]